MAAVGNSLGILQRLLRIREQGLHLLLAFHKELSALVAHPILVRQLLAGLEAEQYIVRVRIRPIGIMNVVGGHQRDIQLPAHLQKLCVHHFLFRISVILQLQKKIPLPKALLVLPRRLSGLAVQPFDNIPLHFSRKTC